MISRFFLALGCTCLSAGVLVGCGNNIQTDLRGHTAFSLSEAGDISVLVQPCGLPIDQVYVVGPLEDRGDYSENPVYLSLTSQQGHPDFFSVDLEHIEENWQIESQYEIPDDPDYLLIAGTQVSTEDAEASQVSATIGDIQQLQPGMVIITSDSKVVPMDEFKQCSR